MSSTNDKSGPYKVEEFVYGILNPHTYWRVIGPSATGLHGTITKYQAGRHCKILNAAFAAGQAAQQWISVEDRLPEKNIEVLVAFKDDKLAGTSQWTSVRPNVRGWLGPIENKGKIITHWQPLPPPPSNT